MREGPAAFAEDGIERVERLEVMVCDGFVDQRPEVLGRLQSARLLGRDPLPILSRLQRIDAVTPAVLHETFKKYFPADRYTVVTLVPEKPGP